MTDRKLLESAAKAYGIRNVISVTTNGLWFNDTNAEEDSLWNPLTNDGDALRLAIKLGIDITKAQVDYWDKNSTDPYAATRRAITHAAAEIGKARGRRS